MSEQVTPIDGRFAVTQDFLDKVNRLRLSFGSERKLDELTEAELAEELYMWETGLRLCREAIEHKRIKIRWTPPTAEDLEKARASGEIVKKSSQAKDEEKRAARKAEKEKTETIRYAEDKHTNDLIKMMLGRGLSVEDAKQFVRGLGGKC